MKKLIHQYITTGIQLSENQLNKLNRNQLNSYLRIRLRNNSKLPEYEFNKLSDEQLNNYLKVRIEWGQPYLSNYEFDRLLGDDMLMYVEKLDLGGWDKLLSNSKERTNKIINYLINSEKFMAKFDWSKLILVKYSEEPDRIINMILQNKEFISKIDKSSIIDMLLYSNVPENVVNILGEKGKSYISNLKSWDIENLLANSIEPDKIFKLLTDMGGEFYDNLTDENIIKLIKFSKHPRKLINGLGKQGEKAILSMNERQIINLFTYAHNFDDLIIGLGKNGEDIISNFNNSDYIRMLLDSVKTQHTNTAPMLNLLLSNSKFLSKLDYMGINEILRFSRILYYHTPNYEKELDLIKLKLRKHGHDKIIDDIEANND